jgi:predicted lactoylglutathione lyase
MDQRLTFITIGVKDFNLMSDFYKVKFEWTPVREMENVIFFKLNGIILALFPEHALAADAHIPVSGSGWKRFSLSINFSSEEEVNHNVEKLQRKGVNLVKAPEKAFWGGYTAYVEDAEFNLWELAYNPFLKMDDRGNVLGHQ